MANEIGKRDQNSQVVLMGITDDASQEIRMLRVDPATNRVLVSGTGGGGGSLTVTDGVTPVTSVTTITFTAGATVTSGGAGLANISVSGGGSLTVLTSTETPNGVLTVFTFPSATGQPTFIDSDNALMRATTKSGTVNWTWAAGPKQATMTIPPLDDICGIS